MLLQSWPLLARHREEPGPPGSALQTKEQSQWPPSMGRGSKRGGGITRSLGSTWPSLPSWLLHRTPSQGKSHTSQGAFSGLEGGRFWIPAAWVPRELGPETSTPAERGPTERHAQRLLLLLRMLGPAPPRRALGDTAVDRVGAAALHSRADRAGPTPRQRLLCQNWPRQGRPNVVCPLRCWCGAGALPCCEPRTDLVTPGPPFHTTLCGPLGVAQPCQWSWVGVGGVLDVGTHRPHPGDGQPSGEGRVLKRLCFGAPAPQSPESSAMPPWHPGSPHHPGREQMAPLGPWTQTLGWKPCPGGHGLAGGVQGKCAPGREMRAG